MSLAYKHIAAFLTGGKNQLSRWVGYIGLGIGVLLLLSAVQMYININELLKTKDNKKNGFDYISLAKIINNDNMGDAGENRFDSADIAGLKAQPFIADAAPLKSNQFKVSAGAGQVIPFSTDIFIEAMDEKMLDTVPPNFKWDPSSPVVPIIFSTDFLEMYNVFAPGWDLPQLSEKTASSVNIALKCHGANGDANFMANIVGFSERVNSILVPENFLDKLNKDLEGKTNVPSSRVFIKTRDANDPKLLDYMQQKGYHINKDKTRFGRLKTTLQAIVAGLAAFGVLVVLLAFMLFSFYLQLMIERSRANLQLMFTLGYSPGWLSRTVAARWVPVYSFIILAALVATNLLHIGFKKYVDTVGDEPLPLLVSWIVIAISVLLLVLSVSINYRMLKRLLYKI